MRIARILVDDEPRYALVGTREGEDVFAVVTGDPLFGAMKPTGEVIGAEETRVLAPVIPRSKVVGIGRNFSDHASELGNEVPKEPLMFCKPNTSVIGPDDPVMMPSYSEDVQFEGELAVVIGRLCKDVPEDRVHDVVAGFTCANDVTARDVQHTDATWDRAKGFDTSCPLGPYLVTDVDPAAWTLTTRLNGEERQRGSASDMVFSVAQLVSYVSSVFTLLPGDVILTGTPAGVGRVEPGGIVEVTIDAIGTLRNTFLAPTESDD